MTGIRVTDLHVRIDKTHILRGVNLVVESGSWLNVIGPNGAGKTTLLRALLGSVRGTGSIDIEGLDDNRPAVRARTLAYVPQTPVMPIGMGVLDYVLLGRTSHHGVFAGDGAKDVAIAADVLARLDLVGFADREVRSLSGGERQRVVMARALTQTTPVLLLDEPTTALDLGHQQELLDLVDELRHERSLTVIATLHDLTLAARYGDRLALLSGGQVCATGSPREVLTVDSIAEHFHATVRIIDDAQGPIIVPTARP